MNQRNNLSIREIDKSEFDEVSHIMAEAFITNPAYSLVFKNKKHLRNGLFWLFKTNLFIHNHTQTLTRIIKDNNTEKIIGAYTLVPPKGVKKNISLYLSIGIPDFIFRFGMNTLLRMLSLSSCDKKAMMDAMKDSKFHYLCMVVVKKEYQGKGIGSFAIKYAIDELFASNTKVRSVGLTTALPENVAFYSGLGFEKINEGYMNFRGGNYYNYCMKLNIE